MASFIVNFLGKIISEFRHLLALLIFLLFAGVLSYAGRGSGRMAGTTEEVITNIGEDCIRLEGPDLALVKAATYFFHPTVSPPRAFVERTDSNPDCMFQLWLWGTFEVRATVIDIRGRSLELSPHYLRFDSYFEKERFEALRLMIRDEGAISA